MKKTLSISIVALVIISTLYLQSCKKKVHGCTDVNSLNFNSAATDDDGSCIYKGKATFWIDMLAGGTTTYNNGAIAVVMSDGTVGVITKTYSSSPSCDASGCFTFSAKPGTYSYTAEGDTTGEWADIQDILPAPSYHGTVTITSSGCTTMHLL